jgi:cell division septum initiation protein DivIVA
LRKHGGTWALPGSLKPATGAELASRDQGREHTMGLMDDAKDVAEEAGHKMGEAAHDTKERIGDKADEMKADADVKAAETNRDSVEKKNELKDQLRNN